MPRAGKQARTAAKALKAGFVAAEGVSPTRNELEEENIHPISAEINDRDITPPATSPGFEYSRMTDDDEVTTGATPATTTLMETDIVPAEVEPPLPMDAFDNATSGEVAPLLRHDSNRTHHTAHHHVHHTKSHEQGLGLEESTPELFLNFAHFVEGSIPEHSTRGGVGEMGWVGEWVRRVQERQNEGRLAQQHDEGYTLFSPLPQEASLPQHHVRGWEWQQMPQIEQMEEELPEAEVVHRRHSSVGRTIPLRMKVRGALRAVGKDVSNTFSDMRHQFTDAVEHLMDNVGKKMSSDELSEQNAAARCLKEGKMAEYHEHQTFANVCAAFSTICRDAVIHEAHAPLVHPRSPLLSATRSQEEIQSGLETSIPSSHAEEARDVSLQNREFLEDEGAERQSQNIAESSNANIDVPLGGAAEAEVRQAEPVVERVRHAADEIYSQLEQAAEDSVAELEHMMDVEEARFHVKALEYLAAGNEVSYHFREAASHAAAAISTLLHRAHEHSVPMTSSNDLSTNVQIQQNENLNQNASPKTQTSIPVYAVPPTPTPSPASGYFAATF